MFTLDQINSIHEQYGKSTTLIAYLQALKAIGISRYDSFVTDGHSEYFGNETQKLVSPSVHETLNVATVGNQEMMLQHLSRHNEGKTTYLEMSEGLARSGTEKWTFDTEKLTLTYYDREGNEMLIEELE